MNDLHEGMNELYLSKIKGKKAYAIFNAYGKFIKTIRGKKKFKKYLNETTHDAILVATITNVDKCKDKKGYYTVYNFKHRGFIGNKYNRINTDDKSYNYVYDIRDARVKREIKNVTIGLLYGLILLSIDVYTRCGHHEN